MRFIGKYRENVGRVDGVRLRKNIEKSGVFFKVSILWVKKGDGKNIGYFIYILTRQYGFWPYGILRGLFK